MAKLGCMRHLRQQLIQLLDQARREQKVERLSNRLAAALVHDFQQLLPFKMPQTKVEMGNRLLSHGDLHRHIITIRCPDQAFYLDAIKGYLLREGIQPLMQQTMVMGIECDDFGCSLELRQPGADPDKNFMFIALHISATLVPSHRKLVSDIRAILRAVELSVADFGPMQETIRNCVGALAGRAPAAAALLAWLNDNRYVYFGMLHDGERLGLLRNKRTSAHIAPGLFEAIEQLPPATEPGLEWLLIDVMHHFLYSTGSVEIFRIAWPETKGGALRSVYVLGHFSRSARYTNSGTLPVLSNTWQELANSRALRHSAFYRREARTIFDRMSKPALLATGALDWLPPIKAIVDLAGPTETVCQFIRPRLGNMVILFVAMAAERFGPNTLRALLDDLERLGIVVHGHENFGVGPHRLLLIYADRQLSHGDTVESIGAATLHETVHRNVFFWKDQAKAMLFRHSREIDMPDALAELETLPKLYADLFPPEQFIADLSVRSQVMESDRIHVRASMHEAAVELHILSPRPIMLGELVDLIRSFGLIAEHEAVVGFGRSEPAMQINCLHCQSPAILADGQLQELRRGIEHVFNDEADRDALNRLLITAGLSIEQIAIVITLRNHLVQLMPEAAPSPLTDMLLRHPRVTAALLELFAARHHPAQESDSQAALQSFGRALESVETLTDDRWFRALGELVQAGLRSNAYARKIDEPVAIKIAPAKLPFGGGSRLSREIFVHGVHLEGVHLRAGPVARGGIRYSDRPVDFRTEIMELMATQTIKNGLIVPTGAKGGFVIRDGDAPAFVLKQYRTFIRALLSLTDNLTHGVAVPPAGIHVPEEDAADPYLVVAADKGTARFSDDANDESRLAGFWLDDAFASGGRHGYDHKAVGITARGAWTCVAHHFARLGQDAWKTPLSCIGIGDMSGDVFGNGMLLNPNLQLIGAFNHRHIFLDPTPNSGKAYAERRRLFTEGKGWGDYDRQHISEGGGVFQRNAKSIPLNEAVRQVLGVEAKRLSGEALIQAMMRAPVDLLYNGGIGTYVKAAAETHAEVRDPANNSVRIDASELRCRVVGEGGNLGFTQRARLEYAAAGGRINTDATDNSGGVDMSDHEVNLKILFSATPASRIGIAERNRLLKRLTDEVTRQCLDDNLMQSRALTLAELTATEHPHRLARLVRELADDDWLSSGNAPGMEREELQSLRPMLSVLLGQEKNRLHAQLSESNFQHASLFADEFLHTYFPAALRRRFVDELTRHPLASEIIATQSVNHVINHIGITSALQLQILMERPVEELIEGLLIAETLLDIRSLRETIWERIADVDSAAMLQHTLQEQVQRFAEELLQLRTVCDLDASWLAAQRKAFHHFRHSLAAQGVAGSESGRFLELLRNCTQSGLATDEAAHLAAMPELSQSAAALHLATERQLPLSVCLKASQACLHLLPFSEMEAPLRSADWGEEEAHPLRREWLHRLSHLKTVAIGQLLDSHSNDLLAEGEKRWGRHQHWQELQDYRRMPDTESEATAEIRRMHLLLALTRLETLIEES